MTDARCLVIDEPLKLGKLRWIWLEGFNLRKPYFSSYESRLGALADLELALRVKSRGPSLENENEDFMVVAGDMLFQVPASTDGHSKGRELDWNQGLGVLIQCPSGLFGSYQCKPKTAFFCWSKENYCKTEYNDENMVVRIIVVPMLSGCQEN